jgi:hypothetical protein
MTAIPKPCRSRLQFSLARFLLFVLVISTILAYIAHRRTWNAQRLAARAALVEQGFQFESKSGSPRFRHVRSFLQWALLEDEYAAPEIGLYTRSPNSTRPKAPRELGLLRYFPEVETIFLRGANDITDESLSFVAAMPNLKSLNLIELPFVTGDFLERLQNPSAMESLRFDHIDDLSSPKLAVIGRMSNLRRLEIVGAPRLTDDLLRGVDLKPNFQELVLYNCPLEDETITRWLSQCKLKVLTLRIRISPSLAGALAKQTDLEELHINNAPLLDAHFAFLKECKYLKRLNLSSLPIQGEFLKILPRPERLEWLELYSTPLPDSRLADLNRFKNLIYLDLSYCPVTGEGFEGTSPWASLDFFRLYGCHFSDEGKKRLQLFNANVRCEFVPPRNWSPADEQAYTRAANSPARYELVSVSGIRGTFSYIIRSLSELQEPIDNAPRNQMAAVLALHEAPPMKE